MAMISLENWGVSLGDKCIVEAVDCCVVKGHTLGIIGESGSGKTVLSRALVGQYPANAQQHGTLYFEGQDTRHFTNKDWQQLRGPKLAYMAQNPMAVFNPYQTIFSHVYEFLASHGITDKATMKKKMLTAMRTCNLENPENLLPRYSFELSGGMLQRCMLSMLLCLSSEVFICDEPTSALDEVNTGLIIQSLQRLKNEGKTLVIVTHDYDVLTALADEVLILKKGVQMEYGEAKQVIRHPKTSYGKKLFQPPLRVRYDHDIY